jgi:carboxymethylenebutenolidase
VTIAALSLTMESEMSFEEIDPALNPELDQLSRRKFVKRAGASAAAATALASGACNQPEKSLLADSDLAQEEVTFKSGSQDVTGFLCRPKTDVKRGSVIVVHEIFGLNPHIKDIACRLARAGFNGLSVNFFTREGQAPSAEGGFQKVMEWVGKVPDAQIMADVRAAASFLKSGSDSNSRVGIVGFCWGGRVSMLAAANVKELSAAVAYYGRIRLAQKNERQTDGPIDLVSKISVPLMGHFGATDQAIPVADVEAFRDELKKTDGKAEIHIYESAGHAFNNDTRESYHKPSADLAWTRTLAWFEKNLKG